MQKVIEPVDKRLLISELTPDKLLRQTNKAGNEIYIVTAKDSPNMMRELGRLREIAFRFYGGGTGTECDIDEFDTMENGYRQLLVWDPKEQIVLGGYRFICGSAVSISDERVPNLATSHLFKFSEKFIKEYLPYTVELGRSFVSLEHQASRSGYKSLFVLDNLWDGLGALPILDPNLKYFFGKVTMYKTINQRVRDLIRHFIDLHFRDEEGLVQPHLPVPNMIPQEEAKGLFIHDNFKDNFKILNAEVRALGFNVPPLVSAYMSLSPQMKSFGTALNLEFGNVEETGILISEKEILEEKKKRHVESFIQQNKFSSFLLRDNIKEE